MNGDGIIRRSRGDMRGESISESGQGGFYPLDNMKDRVSFKEALAVDLAAAG